MPEVLEIEQTETSEAKTSVPIWDSWAVEIPEEIIEAQGLAEGSLVILTLKDGKIQGEVASLSESLATAAKLVLERRRGAYEEMKRLGD